MEYKEKKNSRPCFGPHSSRFIRCNVIPPPNSPLPPYHYTYNSGSLSFLLPHLFSKEIYSSRSPQLLEVLCSGGASVRYLAIEASVFLTLAGQSRRELTRVQTLFYYTRTYTIKEDCTFTGRSQTALIHISRYWWSAPTDIPQGQLRLECSNLGF